MQSLTREQLEQMLDGSKPFHLINVLGENEYTAAHIPGSINIPLETDDFVKAVEEEVQDRQSEIVVYCASASCTASPSAAKKLEQAGFERVYDYEGGMQDWREAGLPVRSEEKRGYG